MTMHAVYEAFKTQTGSAESKLVLVTLADWASECGEGCAKVAALLEWTEIAEEDLPVILQDLQEIGALQDFQGLDSDDGSAIYHYLLDDRFHNIGQPGVSSKRKTSRCSLANLHEAMDGKCFYCGVQTTVTWEIGLASGVREHMTPVSRGGGNSRENITLSCEACNRRKGTLTVEEFRIVCGLASGSMPHTFAGEAAPPVARDVLCVSSKEFVPELIKHNRNYRRPAA